MSLTEYLTGKCYQDFRDWFHNEGNDNYESINGICVWDAQPFDAFKLLSPSMQWGVLVDFADSKGYEILTENLSDRLAKEVKPVSIGFRVWVNRVAFDGSDHSNKFYPFTRYDARQSAIKEFNRLYNENN